MSISNNHWESREIGEEKPQDSDHKNLITVPGKGNRAATTYRTIPSSSVKSFTPSFKRYASKLVPFTADSVSTHSPATTQSVAQRGVAGAGNSLPFLDKIQSAFGHHDISSITAHQDSNARKANVALGASAYATGSSVAFASSPDVYTAAHEAAHVVQQRAGVAPASGVGQVNDPFERHADAVADAVVRGDSAEPILDQMTAGHSATPKTRSVQLRRLAGQNDAESSNIIEEVLNGENVSAMRVLTRAMRQVASQRLDSDPSVLEHIVCRGGGDSYDLHLSREATDYYANALGQRAELFRVRAEQSAMDAEEVTESRDENQSDPEIHFATAFNNEFVNILPGLHQAGQTASTPRESMAFTAPELRNALTPNQRAKLSNYFSTRMIPSQLFSGDDLGGFNARQRILLSGHILTHGHTQPGSFEQEVVHARMCGHFVQLINSYAAASTAGGRGFANQFDHENHLVLGADRPRETYAGEREQLTGDQRTGQRQFRRTGMPIEDFETIEPGDWLYIHTGTNTAGGDHSVVFANWTSDIQTGEGGNRYRIAITFDQSNSSQGGQEHTRYLGEPGSANGHTILSISRVERRHADAHPPQTPQDLLGGDLRGARLRGSEIIAQLGRGAAARQNLQTVAALERRHHGRLNLASLRHFIQGVNHELIGQLRDRASDGQRLLFQEINEQNELDALIRLNERLYVYVHNSDALGEAEQAQTDRIEPRRAEHAAELAEQQASIEYELEIVEDDISRASHADQLRIEVRRLRRQRSQKRRQITHQRHRIRALRGNRGGRREAAIERLNELEGQFEELDRQILALEQRRDQAIEDEHQHRGTGRLGQHIGTRQVLNRLRTRQQRLEAQLASLDADAGFYTVHPGSRRAFRGQTRERGQTHNEPRVTGELRHLTPQPPWAEFIIEGEQGLAQEARQRQRETRRRRRRRRRR